LENRLKAEGRREDRRDLIQKGILPLFLPFFQFIFPPLIFYLTPSLSAFPLPFLRGGRGEGLWERDFISPLIKRGKVK
jgi:hypothetical protein